MLSNKKPRGGDSAPELTSQAAQNTVSALFPVTQAADVVETANLAEARAKVCRCTGHACVVLQRAVVVVAHIVRNAYACRLVPSAPCASGCSKGASAVPEDHKLPETKAADRLRP